MNTIVAERPPLGILPRKLHDEFRLDELHGAICRAFNQLWPINMEWAEEYNELATRLKTWPDGADRQLIKLDHIIKYNQAVERLRSKFDGNPTP